MVLNLAEWQQVKNMCAFKNCRSKVTPFLKSAHKYENDQFCELISKEDIFNPHGTDSRTVCSMRVSMS